MFRTCHLAHLLVCMCVSVSICLSVGRSVGKVYCGKTADWICMLFGMVRGVGHGMGVVDGVLLWNLGKPSKIRPTVSSRQNIPAV